MAVEGEVGVEVAAGAAVPGESPLAATVRALDSPTILKVKTLLLASKYNCTYIIYKYTCTYTSFGKDTLS